MLSYLASRLVQLVVVLWLVATSVFLLMALAGGDGVKAIAPKATDPKVIAQVKEEWGLDNPLHTRYLEWLGDLATFDFRSSYSAGKRPVAEIMAERYPRSFVLALMALTMELSLGLGVAIWAMRRRRPYKDALFTVAMAALVALPVVLAGPLLKYLLGQGSSPLPSFLELPAVGYGGISYYVLPALTIAISSFAFFALVIRAGLYEVLSSEHMRATKAQGLKGSKVFFHAIKNAANPVITLVAIEAGTLIGGVILVETIFSFPGVGLALTDSIAKGDLPVVLGFTLTFTAIFITINFLADLAMALIDPRVRLKGREALVASS